MKPRFRSGPKRPILLFCLSAFAALPACSQAPMQPLAGDQEAGTAEEVIVAAPGRIEGASESVEVGAPMDGIIKALLVTEGQRVQAGDTLVALVCDDLESAEAAARARAEAAKQTRTRLLRGSRDEERREAEARRVAGEAERDQARRRYERVERLFQTDLIVSRDDLDRARRDLDVAEAALTAAAEREALVKAGPLPEEIARANADVEAAERTTREAASRVEKCSIRAPSAGTVLRCHLKAGEQVSLALPRAVVTLADTSSYRVRAEVDERDVGKISVGQEALVTAEAIGGGSLKGRVSRIEPLMGRKRIRTGDPAEKSDRDVQEVIIDLEPGPATLPVGLRVTVRFLRVEDRRE